MQPFLKSVAEYLYRKHGQELRHTALVFPGRRAGLFFRKHLAGITGKPVWLPRMLTISDLMKDLSGMQVADPITLNLKLYKVFCSVTGSSESFDNFYNWGEVMLNDFDEVDKYMVDAGKLFGNIRSLKEIENRFDFMTPGQIELVRQFWGSFNQGSPSSHQKEFMWIWEALPEIYETFRRRLLDEGIAYEGMVFRKVAENLPGVITDDVAGRFFIAGFNALNECEKKLFDHLRKTGKAEFFWDHDELYTGRPDHQAGYFMRENLKRYPNSDFKADTANLTDNPPETNIVAVPSNTGQAKVLNEIEGLSGGGADPLQTAIVLPDESLLLPVLSSLSDDIDDVNVTMGYPLKETSLFGFVMMLAGMQSAAVAHGDGTIGFPGKEVISLLRHPDYPADNPDITARLAGTIMKNNMVFVDAEFAGSGESERLVFRKVEDGNDFLDYLTRILDYMYLQQSASSADENGSYPTDNRVVKKGVAMEESNRDSDKDDNDEDSVVFPGREFFMVMRSAIARLKDVLATTDTAPGFDTMVRLLRKVLVSVRIPFYGEPLGGVQVMGVLETRALDFENVIWLSMNEGVFPSVSPAPSFIPFNLRAACQLPRIEQHEAVYAYYFYRLLNRARKVTLVYNTRSDGMFSGEVSRYIHQLQYSGHFRVKRKSLVFSFSPPEQHPVVIEKTADLIDRLYNLAGAGSVPGYLSAGALNSFMDCSLRFYFRYVARLPEPEKVKADIDMAEFGNLLHKAACFMYRPYIGKSVTTDDIDMMLADRQVVGRCVENAFEDRQAEYRKGGLSGTERIVAGVLTSYMRQILEKDRMLAPFTILSLEENYTSRIDIVSEGRVISVAAGGIIDRVDSPRGITRVADYKTGSDEAVYRTMESLFAREDPKRKKAVFQTFLYSWLYLRQSGQERPVIPVIYQVRKLFTDDGMVIGEKPGRPPARPVKDFKDLASPFEENMRLLLADLFDKTIPFRQTDNHDICRHCAYQQLCHRE